MDIEKLKAIIELLSHTDVVRLEWQSGEERVVLRRGSLVAASAAGRAPAANPSPPVLVGVPSRHSQEPASIDRAGVFHTVTSPFVGTFYRSSSPESPAFVEVGQDVRKGQILCIVEAMKLMNEIEAEVAGRIAEVLVQNGQTVEFGEPLFRIAPDGG
jgi:acetyl-CoA carboxylase biotin carboxyl carrier protein